MQNCSLDVFKLRLCVLSGRLFGLRLWDGSHVHLGHRDLGRRSVQHDDGNLLRPVRHGGVLEPAVEALEASSLDPDHRNLADLLRRLLRKHRGPLGDERPPELPDESPASVRSHSGHLLF